MEPSGHSGELFAALFPTLRCANGNTPETNAWHELVVDVFGRELSRAAILRPPPCGAIGLCPMADMGESVLDLLHITCHFAERLAHGELAHRAVKEHVDFMVHTKDGEKLMTYLDGKHAALKQIVTRLNEVTNTCRQIWADIPPYSNPNLRPEEAQEQEDNGGDPPFSDDIEYQLSASDISEAGDDMNIYQENRGGAYGEVHAEDRESPQVSTEELLQRLKSRGSGSYTCTQGMTCKKGGVKDGQLKVFKRNSEFRMHMERHEKPYKCDLPGCNKSFSRPDLLGRHKKSAKHLGEQSVLADTRRE